ncbi:hypothetical protein GCM10012290_07450 [Halolactibacillus alkaliphilus]|uniref:Uncharacterized protein n=1 Tax=Halolactibacillus alkaliphilus TaxID=442899 RepID=A0A511WZI7_9BACI|nr:hypothetical protein HAL01_05650 [Halolactibacillus alkaliphilus]GGN67204.1 hypothetical protein GCM10012290_07450 [Halolactibacillus alkaliphilus]
MYVTTWANKNFVHVNPPQFFSIRLDWVNVFDNALIYTLILECKRFNLNGQKDESVKMLDFFALYPRLFPVH